MLLILKILGRLFALQQFQISTSANLLFLECVVTILVPLPVCFLLKNKVQNTLSYPTYYMTTYCIQNTEVQYLQQQNQVPSLEKFLYEKFL